METTPLEEELKILEVRLKQLRLDYEQYFLGSRPREPQQARSEIQKAMVRLSSTPIQNTALRFKFNGINQRFQVFKRQWDTTLRQIEDGTYGRHVFKAKLHERERGLSGEDPKSGKRPPAASSMGELFEHYRDAAMACGQDVSSLTPEKLQRVVAKQQDAVRQKLGCENVDFRVEVQNGKVKLKASARR